ncbi:hypothetical protein NP233_g4308 [Leucocoprinus birnbaumii]|uniref:Uncharacterized protein n=1 Tax=Leucocoprinus birnbaumii TaxID=56174 RepID=A0AAD5VVK6_9AGAR|nr:hypothetical protein NP233_g4308 [Leucocoprinus birnbaumii]
MWARLSSALKSTTSKHGQDDQSQNQTQLEHQQQQRQQQYSTANDTLTQESTTPNQTLAQGWNHHQSSAMDLTNNASQTEVMNLLTNQTFAQQSLGRSGNQTFGLDLTNNASQSEVLNLLTNQTFGDRTQNQTFGRSMDMTNKSQTEVMNILTDMSDFHSSSDGPSSVASPSSSTQPPPIQHIPQTSSQRQPSPPPSPSRRSLFKRGPKEPKGSESDSVRGSGSLKLLPKKIRGSLPFGNGIHRSSSRASLASPTVETETAQGQTTKHKRSQDTLRSFASVVRRPSLDLLRTATNESGRPSIVDSPVDLNRNNSVRSILRDPNTPGTGQNVRFFPRDAFKVISPEESMEENFLSPPSQIHNAPDHSSFVNRLNQLGSSHTSTPMGRVSSPPPKSRPSLNGVFAPLEESSPNERTKSSMDNGQSPSGSSGDFMSLSGALAPPDFNANGSLDMDRPNHDPAFPPGLSFDVGSPLLDSAIDLDFLVSDVDEGEGRVTSTPFKPSGKGARWKGKEREESIKEEEEEESRQEEKVESKELVNAPQVVDEDETIFRPKPVFSPPIHERSQSFSFGQTVFHSMGRDSPATASSPAYPSNDKPRPPENGSAVSSPSIPASSVGRHRSRALSDTVFQNMLRATSPILEKHRASAPEADINDEFSADLQIYAPTEPDPFNANANTYYTPQTMIPTTPPAGVPRHTRKTSKEENLIYSLQTQLTLQTELCSQYEADLRAKDEMVELLGKKLTDMEKQENQRKGALRQWKKKVQELERAVRLLEEEVDVSKQESLERSVMDEASGEALRMLHRQIANLEKEKAEWVEKEKTMREEAETLESRLLEAKEQIDTLGNVSLVGVDEEELRKLAERELKVQEERQAYHIAEMNWEQERAELMIKIETMQVEKTKVEEQLDSVKQQFKSKEEEFDVMKSELEAQWGHTETASDRIKELQLAKKDAEEEVAKVLHEKEDVVAERDELAQRCEEAEQRANNFELDWNESENRKHELECEVHELWDEKDALEKERDEFEQKLSQERERAKGFAATIEQFEDRIAQIEQDRQFGTEDVARLEEEIRQRDEEIARYSEKLRAQRAEVENLQDEIGTLKREYDHVLNDLNEHSRALKDATGSGSESRRQLQDLLRQKTDADGELKSQKERNESLKNEMERLRKHLHELQQESADKEVKIVQLTKQHGQDKEDIQGLNIALDAKQQELELYKRKAGIKSSSSTSVPPSSSRVLHRRDSSTLFDGTPASTRPPSRATSVVSDSRSTKSEKAPALGRSNRINSLNGTTGSAIKIGKREGSVGSMGPPPPLKRPSLTSATPTPAPRPGVTSRVKSPTGTGAAAVPVRRVVSGTQKVRAGVTSPTSSSISEESSEKENLRSPMGSDKTVRRRSMVPAPM